jgi:predicted O-linked N-acetylglucosamine transferase (SPINDLY family)
MGYIHLKLNNMSNSIINYKLCIEFLKQQNTDNSELLLSSYNGLASVFRYLKMYYESYLILTEAKKFFPLDPNINNHLGIIYTELRQTGIAEDCYKIALDNFYKTVIDKNPQKLLSDIYLNYGQMKSYNGDNEESINLYTKSLDILIKNNENITCLLPFQNKVMNLLYLYNELTKPEFIFEQHKLINKILTCVPHSHSPTQFPYLTNPKPIIKIGFVSGDFQNHPVSFFINSFIENPTFYLKKYNFTFEFFFYSENIINYESLQNFKIIKNKTTEQVCQFIRNDNIDVLIDLSGNTCNNRLDVFSLKPTKIQISYCGYPYTTGLNTIDYKIVDKNTDSDTYSRKHYVEKLLYMDKCFLNYSPNPILSPEFNSNQQIIPPSPFNDKIIYISSFNRLNKITRCNIELIQKILLHFKGKVVFVFKTKALLNNTIKKNFLNHFNKQVQKYIIIKDCNNTHNNHILEYNNINIAYDTFPYSGTTTSCEALNMGVPVLTLFNKEYYHPQNVSSSLLINSELSEWVCYNHDDFIIKIQNYINNVENKNTHLICSNKVFNYKKFISEKFKNGYVYNQKYFLNNFCELIFQTIQSN